MAARAFPRTGLFHHNALDRFNISIAALTMNKALGLSATTHGLGAGADIDAALEAAAFASFARGQALDAKSIVH